MTEKKMSEPAELEDPYDELRARLGFEFLETAARFMFRCYQGLDRLEYDNTTDEARACWEQYLGNLEDVLFMKGFPPGMLEPLREIQNAFRDARNGLRPPLFESNPQKSERHRAFL